MTLHPDTDLLTVLPVTPNSYIRKHYVSQDNLLWRKCTCWSYISSHIYRNRYIILETYGTGGQSSAFVLCGILLNRMIKTNERQDVTDVWLTKATKLPKDFLNRILIVNHKQFVLALSIHLVSRWLFFFIVCRFYYLLFCYPFIGLLSAEHKGENRCAGCAEYWMSLSGRPREKSFSWIYEVFS